MADSLQPADVRALLEFREKMELGDVLFHEITGLEASQLFAYRRGKLKERPSISSLHLARVERCKAAMQLALELTNDEEKALDWLYTESPTFHGKSPIDLTINVAGLEFLHGYIGKLRAAVQEASSTRSATAITQPEPVVPAAQKSIPAVVVDSPPAAPTQLAKTVPVPVSTEKSAAAAKEIPVATERPKKDRQEKTPIRDETKPSRVTLSDTSDSTAAKTPSAPPEGVAPDDRVFRLRDPLKKIRAARPELTLKVIGGLMVKRGFKQYESTSYMSRVSNSYAWATWEEVVAMAEALEVDPKELGSVWTKN